jgi:hypothetical protein
LQYTNNLLILKNKILDLCYSFTVSREKLRCFIN